MALSQDDRIAISKAFAAAPAEIAQIETNKAQVVLARAELEKKDLANKGLVDRVTTLIDPYQVELGLKNGNLHTLLTETVQQDAAKRKIGNFLFPNEQAVPLPSVSDGIWKFFSPFFGSYGIGKQKLEVYGSVSPYEQQLITDINAQIAILEAATLIQRTTGQSCATVNVPPLTDFITPFATVQTAMSTLITKVGQWQTNLNSSLTALANVVAVDTNAGRITAKNTEQTSINTALAGITAWLAHPDFNTSHGQTTCAGFNGYNAALLAPTKGYTTQLNAFKTIITNRSSQVTTRISEVSGYLGSVTQSPANGDITGGSGFYLERAYAINLRLHAMGGSLSALISTDKSIEALNQFKKNKQDAVIVYQGVMVVSLMKAPANGTNTLHLKDITGLSVGNQVYIITETQPEIPLTIQAISGTMITVDKQISQSYRESELGRVYKVL
jgi:hypothetical protein